MSAVGLHLVDPDGGFVLCTHASNYAISAVFGQVLDDGRHMPVAFWSRVLAARQRRTWTPREKEANASVMAHSKWAEDIALPHVTVCTGPSKSAVVAQAALWIPPWGQPPEEPHGTRPWLKWTQQCVYLSAKDNTVADCLGRRSHPASKGRTDMSAHGDEAQSPEAKTIIDMECLMEAEGV